MKTTMWWVAMISAAIWVGVAAVYFYLGGAQWLGAMAMACVCLQGAGLESIKQALREMFCDGDCEGCDQREQES
jgi:hypothetical protein